MTRPDALGFSPYFPWVGKRVEVGPDQDARREIGRKTSLDTRKNAIKVALPSYSDAPWASGPEGRAQNPKKVKKMSAIIRSGGKQYRVEVGQHIVIERLVGEEGADVTFDQVLSMGDGDAIEIGTPTLVGVSVQGRIIEQKRGRKILVFRRKRRKNFRRLNGHRQYQTVVEITGIGGSVSKKSVKKTPTKAGADPSAKPEQSIDTSGLGSAPVKQPKTKEASAEKSPEEQAKDREPMAKIKPNRKPKKDAIDEGTID